MTNALTPVTFNGASLFTTLINGVPHVALKPIVEAIGLDWKSQYSRLIRHPVLSKGVVITTIPSAGGDQQAVCLPLDKLNGWLFGVNSSRARPEIRERLIAYQRECFDVLASHFKAATPAPAPARALPPPGPSINVRAVLLTGQSEPVALTRAQQAEINRHAFALAHEAYELIRQHLERRVAHRTTPVTRQSGAVGSVVRSVTLGHALAHQYHAELEGVQDAMRILKMFADNGAGKVQQALAVLAGNTGNTTTDEGGAA